MMNAHAGIAEHLVGMWLQRAVENVFAAAGLRVRLSTHNGCIRDAPSQRIASMSSKVSRKGARARNTFSVQMSKAKLERLNKSKLSEYSSVKIRTV